MIIPFKNKSGLLKADFLLDSDSPRALCKSTIGTFGKYTPVFVQQLYDICIAANTIKEYF